MKLTSNLIARQAYSVPNRGEVVKSKVDKEPAEQLSEASDTVSLSRVSSLGGRLKSGLRKALLSTAMAVSLAGPVAAQMPAGTAPLLMETAAKTEMVHHQKGPEQTANDSIAKPQISVRGYFINDNMPTFMSGALGGPNSLVPGSKYADDDGWTSELRLETTVTKPTQETFVGARLNMVTETGSWIPGNTDFQGRRTDVGELVVQENFRRELSGGKTLDFGFGGGVQAFGNVGGEKIQRWWHGLGTFGGRVGEDLQGNQVSESARFVPIATAGVKITSGEFHGMKVFAGAQTTLPFGSGLGYVGAKAGVKGDFGPVNVELGGKLDAAWNLAPELSFHNPTGIQPGAYLRTEVQAGKIGGVFAQAEVGGVRAEPIFTVGVKVGLGQVARLNPFW